MSVACFGDNYINTQSKSNRQIPFFRFKFERAAESGILAMLKNEVGSKLLFALYAKK
jgi:hypothetical protein